MTTVQWYRNYYLIKAVHVEDCVVDTHFHTDTAVHPKLQINQHFELDYLMFTHFDIIYDICEHSCNSPENLN